MKYTKTKLDYLSLAISKVSSPSLRNLLIALKAKKLMMIIESPRGMEVYLIKVNTLRQKVELWLSSVVFQEVADSSK